MQRAPEIIEEFSPGPTIDGACPERSIEPCETINGECLATELLPCECIMRRPIASLCSAPMELGFDPPLSRLEPRSFVFWS
jgi:hypothetical protein